MTAFHVKQSEAFAGADVMVSQPLSEFLALLAQWNRRINLIGSDDESSLRHRHIADCQQLIPLIPPGDGAIADLGSGAGLPGLVIAMALSRPIHLIEADRRKAAFLTEAAARLGLRHVTVHPIRIERARVPPMAVVTARALAPLDQLLAYAAPLLAPGGVALFPKGRGSSDELHAATQRWAFNAESVPSVTDPDAAILRLSDIRPRLDSCAIR